MAGWQSPIGPLPAGVQRILEAKPKRARCESATKPTWYRPKGGTCVQTASFLVNGKRMCGTHYRVYQEAKARKKCPHCGQTLKTLPSQFTSEKK